MRFLLSLAALALCAPGWSANPDAGSSTRVQVTRAVNPNDYFPPAAVRRGEQGKAEVQSCVGPTGRLLRDPVITATSGFPDIDGAAITVAKAMEYAAGTENGVALPESCLTFTVQFNLDARARMAVPANPDSFYPSSSARLKEQGSPIVQACVGPTGKLLREPVVTESSGFPDLDAAAVKAAKASRYAPGLINGTPLPESCIKYKVKFGH